MKYLLSIISLNIKQYLYFKMSAVFSLFSFLVLFLIKSSLWSKIGNTDYISYFGIITIISSFISLGTDRYIKNIYQTGAISSSLLLPINFGVNIFLKDFAKALSNFLLRSLPLLAVLLLFFRMNIYFGMINFSLFIFSVLCAYFFNWLIAYIIGLCVFFYNNNEGFIQIKNILFLFFSGALIPLDFFPQKLQKILNFLPFKVLYQIPVEILNSTHLNSVNLISKQVLWIFLSLMFAIVFHKTAIKKIQIIGG